MKHLLLKRLVRKSLDNYGSLKSFQKKKRKNDLSQRREVHSSASDYWLRKSLTLSHNPILRNWRTKLNELSSFFSVSLIYQKTNNKLTKLLDFEMLTIRDEAQKNIF